jgi:hypothetical protein
MSSADESAFLPDMPATLPSRGSLQMLQLLPSPRLLYPLGSESLQVINPHLLLGDSLPNSAPAPDFENQIVFGRPRRYAFAREQPTIPTVQRLPSQIEFAPKQTTLAPAQPTPQSEVPQAQSKEFADSSENIDTATILPSPSITSTSSPPTSALPVSLQMNSEETASPLQTGDIPPVIRADSASETSSFPMPASTEELIAPIQRRVDIASDVAKTDDPSFAPSIVTTDPQSSFIATPELAGKKVVEPIASLSSVEPHRELPDTSLQTSAEMPSSEGTIHKATHLPFPDETPEKATFAFPQESSPVNLQSALSPIKPQISEKPTLETSLETLTPTPSSTEDEHSTRLREVVEPSATEPANSINTVAPTSGVPNTLQAFESPELLPAQNQLLGSETLGSASLEKSDSKDRQQKVTDTEPFEIGISASLQKTGDLHASLAQEHTPVSDEKALPQRAFEQPVEGLLSRQVAITTTDQPALRSASLSVPEPSLPARTSESVLPLVQPKVDTLVPPDRTSSLTSAPDTSTSFESASSPQQLEVLYETPIQRQVATTPEPVVSTEPIDAETSASHSELPTTPSASEKENREQGLEEVAEGTTPAFGSEPPAEGVLDIPQTQLQSEETLQLSASRDSETPLPPTLAELQQSSQPVEPSPIQRQVAATPEPLVSVEPIDAETSAPQAELPTTPSASEKENREQVPEDLAERTFGGAEGVSELLVVQAASVVQEFPALTSPRLGLQRQPEHLLHEEDFSVLNFGETAQELPLYTQPPAEQQVSVSAAQRKEEPPAPVAPPPTQTDHSSPPPPTSGGQDQLEALAQAVYALLRHRIVRERERQGIYIGRLPW